MCECCDKIFFSLNYQTTFYQLDLKNKILFQVQAKKEAEKRAKTMAELDDEFGVGDLVQEKLKQDQKSR